MSATQSTVNLGPVYHISSRPVSRAAVRAHERRALPLRTRLGLDATRHAGYYVVPPMGSSLPIVRVQCGKMALAMASTCRGMVAKAE